MKRKIIFITALFALAATAYGQSMYDAIAFSENNYYGTARTQALGNAVTALGSDLGSIAINPAGSAVAGYSQFSLTPGTSISSVKSSYAPVYGESSQSVYDATKARFTMPNAGISFRFDTGNRSGLKSLSLAFLVNTSGQHLFRSEAAGDNNMSSISGSFAAQANMNSDGRGNMMDPNVFKNYDNPYYDSNYGWNELAAYNSNMISFSEADNAYVGVAETIDGKIPGTLRQASVREALGSKNDVVTNISFNIDEKFFFGFNLGVPSQRYAYDETFMESAKDPEQFPVGFHNPTVGDVTTRFLGSSYRYSYSAKIDGIYGKFGFIWVPDRHLRLGASIQSPTSLTISETYRNSTSTAFADSRFDAEELSPTGNYRYRLKTPYNASFGLAYVFGSDGLFSIDYEITDFSVMNYKEVGYDRALLQDPFEDINTCMRLFCGLSHQLRTGLEFRLSPAFALRAGYILRTSPELHYINNEGDEVWVNDYLARWDEYHSRTLALGKKLYDSSRNVHTISAGFGFDSGRSFFADASFRCTLYPKENFAPYAQYYETIQSPNVNTARKLFDAALTIGWRF